MSRTTERSEATGSGSYQAVPFSYGNNNGSVDPNSCGPSHSAFHPPFSVPTGLLNNLVLEEKEEKIALETLLGTTHTYVLGDKDKSTAKRVDLLRGQKSDKVDATIHPEELEVMDDVLAAK